jgi:hypothetical protein
MRLLLSRDRDFFDNVNAFRQPNRFVKIYYHLSSRLDLKQKSEPRRRSSKPPGRELSNIELDLSQILSRQGVKSFF